MGMSFLKVKSRKQLHAGTKIQEGDRHLRKYVPRVIQGGYLVLFFLEGGWEVREWKF